MVSVEKETEVETDITLYRRLSNGLLILHSIQLIDFHVCFLLLRIYIYIYVNTYIYVCTYVLNYRIRLDHLLPYIYILVYTYVNDISEWGDLESIFICATSILNAFSNDFSVLEAFVESQRKQVIKTVECEK